MPPDRSEPIPYVVLVLARDGETMLFASPEQAASYMEPIDVLDGEYRIIVDSHGVGWEALVEKDRRWLGTVERVRLRRTHADPRMLATATAELRAQLGLAPCDDGKHEPSIIAHALRVLGYTR